MLRTYYIETHGCQMNEHDSEKLGGLLLSRGMSPASSPDEADLFLLNTCSVREKAVQKVYSRLGKLRGRRRSDPGFVVGVVGCVAQQEGVRLTRRAPYVDLVVGTHQYHSLPDLLDEVMAKRKAGEGPQVAVEFDREHASPPEMPPAVRTAAFRAQITIMEGCNKHCAFCIVPSTRGVERNRPSARILDEARQALDEGRVEIQLLGQTVNSYRDPERRGYRFAELLAEVASLPGLRRLRFTSPHPRHFTEEVLQAIAAHPSICDQVHLPLQSGSSRVLRRMRRQHDREWYMELVERLRGGSRPVALSTDIIVGFPGETDPDFEDTLSLVEFAQYEQMFSFKYSVRPGTEAEGWEDDVPESVKGERLNRLQARQKEIQLKIHQDRYLGREFELLTEGAAKDGRLRFGRTTTNKIVNFPGDEAAGEFVVARVTGIGPNSLLGENVIQCRLVEVG